MSRRAWGRVSNRVIDAEAENWRTAYNGRMSHMIDEAYLERYRIAWRQRAEQRAETVAERLRSARAGADAAARVLRESFGAAEVYLFGSVADGIGFDESSDINMAVSGVAPTLFWTAGSAAERATGGFVLDLHDLHYATDGISEHIRTKGVPL